MALISPSTKRLCYSTATAIVVMMVLYAVMVPRSPSNKSGGTSIDSTLRTASINNNAPIGSTAMTNPLPECRVMPPVHQSEGLPLWVAGYPGSGFDLLAPIIAFSTGLTAVDVYRHHTCSVPAAEGAAMTGACMSHWPVIQKDAPANVAITGAFYNPQAVFVIRNPANAIPSYFTRWWGAQRRVQHNRQQPPENEWIEWRDSRFDHHLTMWKQTLLEWHRGIPAAGVTGIGMYIPYEKLSSPTEGPLITRDIAKAFAEAKHVVHSEPPCLWRKAVDRSQLHKAKAYEPHYTNGQKQSIVQALDELILMFGPTDAVLTNILHDYRSNLPWKVGPS